MNYKENTKLTEVLYKIYSVRWLKAIRYGLITIQPLVLACCILLIIPYIQSYIFKNAVDIGFVYFYNKIYYFSRIILLATISYYLAVYKNEYLEEKVNPTIVAIIGLLSAIIITKDINNPINSQNNSIWVFLHLIISILSSELFMFLYIKINKRIRFLDNGHDYILKQSVNSILPTIILFCLLYLFNLMYRNTGVNLQNQIYEYYKNMKSLYGNGNIFTEMKYLFDGQLYWFLGGHGGNIIETHLGNTYLNVFCNIGGTGSTLCLIVAILICNLHNQSKEVAKLSILPSIFNINEIIVYGLPIILNPLYVIPFIFTPIVLSVITNLAQVAGFIDIKEVVVNWQVPVFINAYISTKSIGGIVLQIVNIIIGVIIYMPFVVLSYKIYSKEKNVAYEKLKELIFTNAERPKKYIKRIDNIGQISNILACDLRMDLNIEDGLYLEYQPQVNKRGIVVGVESLLRWKHKDFGNIPPNIAITLAEENESINDLGKWIIKKSCYQLYEWNKVLDYNIDMSVNIASVQLKDPSFAADVIKILDEYKINPNNLKLEITETGELGNDDITKIQLQELTNKGVKLAIDDFGVGYNPILYIKKYHISTIKLDGSLIKDIDTNEESRNIVKAMYLLCETSDIEVVSEFVENNTQKDILDNMGDGIYQGYLFSKPLGAKDCLDFINNSYSEK